MTRQECEAKLFNLMKQAYEIARQYDPTINHIGMFKIDDYVNVRGGHDIGGGVLHPCSVNASWLGLEECK